MFSCLINEPGSKMTYVNACTTTSNKIIESNGAQTLAQDYVANEMREGGGGVGIWPQFTYISSLTLSFKKRQEKAVVT
jgi:hypothetical protein